MLFSFAGFTSRGFHTRGTEWVSAVTRVRRGPGGRGSARGTRLCVTAPGGYRSKQRCWAGTDGMVGDSMPLRSTCSRGDGPRLLVLAGLVFVGGAVTATTLENQR